MHSIVNRRESAITLDMHLVQCDGRYLNFPNSIILSNVISQSSQQCFAFSGRQWRTTDKEESIFCLILILKHKFNKRQNETQLRFDAFACNRWQSFSFNCRHFRTNFYYLWNILIPITYLFELFLPNPM